MKISLKIKTGDKKKFTKNFMRTIFWGAVSLEAIPLGEAIFQGPIFYGEIFLGYFSYSLLYAASGHYYMNKISFCVSFES